MWSGTSDAIPTGWVLCNGENGTPDLRNRFIVGAGDEYEVGDVGGVANYTFAGQYLSGSGSRTGNIYAKVYTSDYPSSWTHDNRPPYYALCFIMKI